VVAEFRQRRMATADRERAAFIVSMGVSRDLNELIRTVKFETLHLLTRAELHRFGIDPRPFAEATWRLDTGTQPAVSKIAVIKKENGASFRTMELRLYCEARTRVPLMFAAEIDGTIAGKSTLQMTADADTSKSAGGAPARSEKYEMWTGSLDPDMVKAITASRALHVRQTMTTPDEKTETTTFDIELTSLAAARNQLAAACASLATKPKAPWPSVPLPSANARPQAP